MKTTVQRMFMPAALLLLLSGCSAGQKKESRPEPAIRVTDASVRMNNSNEEFPFISKPYRTTELSFRVNGPLCHFDVIAGNYYRKGELIAAIDPRDFRIRLDRAEALYEQANAEFTRVSALYEKNNLPASTFEKARADYTAAKANLETARNELNDTRLIAPFDGYAGEVYVENYQDVTASRPVLNFVELDQLRIEAYVPGHAVGNMQKGARVDIVFDAFPDQRFEASVSEISKNTTRNNLSYLLTSAFENKDHRILAGMSGKVVFQSEMAQNAPVTVIPGSAVCHRPSLGDYVWVVDPADSVVRLRQVKTGEMLHDGSVEIRDGITAGEQVAVSGLRFLSDQKKVAVIPESVPASVTENRSHSNNRNR